MRQFALGFVVVALLAGSAGCTSPTSPTTYSAGLSTQDVTVGTGAEAVAGKTLVVNYTGWLYDATKADKKGAQFDASPAGQPFVIRFNNKEAIPHNVAIYDGTENLFRGDIVTGPTTVEYQVPALEAGEYDFLCEVHPDMAGTVIAE